MVITNDVFSIMVMDEVCVRITGAKLIPTWKGPYPLTKLAELAINMIFL